ncbi:MAG: ribulose bisphosphate carboxylase small subunit [Pseudanabaenaceae cyanobacterium bins.68]|nr:ribulose bisphosphate carboxylase small subunit [Pseudanabaenaceae cyanobacterium bins.68]
MADSQPQTTPLIAPIIAPTAQVHAYANVIGEVYVGEQAQIAPGSSIRADSDTAFYLSAGVKLRDGAMVRGLERGRVQGDNHQEYSVWLGKEVTISHMALIHGPAYLGDRTFVGFRSTVFNARLGEDVIVGMHALVQDVEIPTGRYVPSGAVITSQDQADHLPEASREQLILAQHLAQRIVPSLGQKTDQKIAGGLHPSSGLQVEILGQPLPSSVNSPSNLISNLPTNSPSNLAPVTPMPNTTIDYIQQTRQLLAQGYRISAEYADERRYRTSSWQSCSGIAEANHEQAVLSAIQACLTTHQGAYVRLLGIDPKTKRRAVEVVIQRPGNASQTSQTSTSVPSYSSSRSGNLSQDVIGQVRQLLAQGYRIGTEHADERRFRTSSWHSCAPIQASSESEVISHLEACLLEHSGEYVRLLGIDHKNKRRVLELIVQRPGQTVAALAQPSGATNLSGHTSIQTSQGNGNLVGQVRQLLAQGYRIGAEYADERRFRTSSWYSCATIHTSNESEAIASLNSCIAEHPGAYVRLIGIDPKSKRRVLELIVQRPHGTSPRVETPQPPSSNHSSSTIKTETLSQIRQLLLSGHRISAEYADERRFRTSSWHSCRPITASTEVGVAGALEACLAEHPGEYVRLIGVDPKSKRRVLETIVQRP